MNFTKDFSLENLPKKSGNRKRKILGHTEGYITESEVNTIIINKSFNNFFSSKKRLQLNQIN